MVLDQMQRRKEPNRTGGRNPEADDMESLILEAGRRLNRPEADILPYIQLIVKDNWITSRKAAEKLTRKQWLELQVPALLLNEILHLLSTENGRTEVPVPTTTESIEPGKDIDTTEINRLASDDYLTEVVLAVPGWHPLAESSLVMAHDQLLMQNEDTKVALEGALGNNSTAETSPLRDTLLTLVKLLDNILAEPENPKKRRIRLGNPIFQKKIGHNTAAINFLQSAGFIIVGDFLDLPIAFLSRITDARQLIAESLRQRFAVNTPLLPETASNACFNPFQPNITYNVPATNALMLRQEHTKAVQVSVELDDKIAALQNRFQGSSEIVFTDQVPLQARIFRNEGGRRSVSSVNSLLRQVVRGDSSQSEDEGYDPDTRKSSKQLSFTTEDLARIKCNLSDGPMFSSRRRKEYKALQNRPHFCVATLRVQFPDDFILELNFRSTEKVAAVRDTLRTFLHGDVRDKPFYLYQTPPVRRLDPDKTLYNERLPPKSVVRFGIEGQRPGIAPEGKSATSVLLHGKVPSSKLPETPQPQVGSSVASQYLDPVAVAKYWTETTTASTPLCA